MRRNSGNRAHPARCRLILRYYRLFDKHQIVSKEQAMNERIQKLVQAMLAECYFLAGAAEDSAIYIRTKNILIENLKLQGIK